MFGNDITKCDGVNCPSRDKCYRYTVKPDKLQSYSGFWMELNPGDLKCEYFWRVENERNKT